MQRWRGFVLTAVLVALSASFSGAAPLPTARTHRIEVAGAPGGLEAQMPRTGAYARGVRADSELDFGAARQLYTLAVDEFRRRGAELWADKASRQVSYSMTLERAPMMFRQMAPLGSVVSSAQWRLPFALAYHEKYLSTRAFLGRPVPELAARARAVYRQILDAEPDNASARLDLAALYAEMGERADAEAEFARVGEARRSEDGHAIELARYYAARGEADAALRALERARRRLPGELRELGLMNSFDRVRRDPRFEALAGPSGGRGGTGPGSAWPDRPRPGPRIQWP
ncbi:MAG TPA: tetratricopeptide repeat protein [Polyangia bacterium]|nr:tetratricopeptide repeat protein [Polyangia bacterium]